jgi:hypothetical protein
MEAVEAGTGKQFVWSVITKTRFLSRKAGKDVRREDLPWWLELMRQLSYGEPRTRRARKLRTE